MTAISLGPSPFPSPQKNMIGCHSNVSWMTAKRSLIPTYMSTISENFGEYWFSTLLDI